MTEQKLLIVLYEFMEKSELKQWNELFAVRNNEEIKYLISIPVPALQVKKKVV